MEYYGKQEFATKKDLFKFLSENRDKLIAQKKAVKKEADCPVLIMPTIVREAKKANKAGIMDMINADYVNTVVIINTTNFLDSHGDVHIPGLWSKSLQENKHIMHIQEHDMEFDKIIADGPDLKAYTKTFTWAELGYSYKGSTEALVFESHILRKRNPFMLDQYANGWVKNHSVGMYYVKMDFAINDEEFPNEFEAWNKYYPQVANQDVADQRGYFFYVLEAKCVEGSAVPIGSNTATPTLSTGKSAKDTCPDCGCEIPDDMQPDENGNMICPDCGVELACKPKKQPEKSTVKNIEPPKGTQIDYKHLLNGIKNI